METVFIYSIISLFSGPVRSVVSGRPRRSFRRACVWRARGVRALGGGRGDGAPGGGQGRSGRHGDVRVPPLPIAEGSPLRPWRRSQ